MMQTGTLEAQANIRMLTIAQVAQLLHVHPNSVRRWTNEGLLNLDYPDGLKPRLVIM